jgi:demethylmenaquinone methyltransferase/2-methoxy-6-polyprenyl-1,4-benzoquinol methylase
MDAMETAELFDDIAPKYDRMNRLLSLGLDRGWRRQAVRALAPIRPRRALDVATGSGELALALLALAPEQVAAVDISRRMLELAAAKAAKRHAGARVVFERAAAEGLPFADSSFDAVTVGFGVRNFADLEKGLAEMLRVLKPGGVAAILEFSLPGPFPLRLLHRIYLKKIIPLLGRLAAGNQAAYVRLAESILAFPHGEGFTALLAGAGFSGAVRRRLSLGVCTVYCAVKPAGPDRRAPDSKPIGCQ